MQAKQIKVIAGVVCCVIGVICTTVWGSVAVVFLQGCLSIGLLVVGVWAIVTGVALDWRAIGRNLVNPDAPPPAAASAMHVDVCPHCSTRTQPGLVFCQSCGKRLPQPALCPSCKAPNPAEATFCGECGGAMTTAAPAEGAK